MSLIKNIECSTQHMKKEVVKTRVASKQDGNNGGLAEEVFNQQSEIMSF